MIRYLLVSTARSGSTYLCDLLEKTGRMGEPDEYFNEDLRPHYEKLLTHPDHPNQSYKDKIIWQSRKENDCVGVNVNSKADFAECIKSGFAQTVTHYIRLTREYKVLQAISLYKATETQKYHSHTIGNGKKVEYDRQKIQNMLNYLADQEKFWDHYLEGKPVLEISYEEDLLTNPLQTVYCILDHVGLPLTGMGEIVSQMKILRNEESKQWAERFKKETYG